MKWTRLDIFCKENPRCYIKSFSWGLPHNVFLCSKCSLYHLFFPLSQFFPANGKKMSLASSLFHPHSFKPKL